MLSGVGILCFAASYAVALTLEVSRLLFRSGVRGFVMLGFAGAGLIAHTAFLYHRAVSEAGAPLSSEQDWFLVAAWVLVVAYLFLAVLHPKAPFGLFLLPLALGLIGAARFLAQNVPLAREPASRVWGALHGISISLAAVSVLLGFVAGLMYLGQVRRLKHKRPPAGRGPRLPSLEWLQWANSRAILVSVLMLGLGILAGMILNLTNADRDGWRVPWSDPVVLSTWAMFVWLLAALLIASLPRPSRQGRRVAFLTLASFVFLVIVLAVGLLIDSRHWGRGERGEGRGERERACMSVVVEEGSRHVGSVEQQTVANIANTRLTGAIAPFSGRWNVGLPWRSCCPIIAVPATAKHFILSREQYSKPTPLLFSPLSPLPSPLSKPGGPPC